MAYAPNEYLNTGKIAGIFRNKETGAFFEYLNIVPNEYAEMHGATHSICVNDIMSSPLRGAIVKKTVAYIMIDEDDNGNPVWEKWAIKDHRFYL